MGWAVREQHGPLGLAGLAVAGAVAALVANQAPAAVSAVPAAPIAASELLPALGAPPAPRRAKNGPVVPSDSAFELVLAWPGDDDIAALLTRAGADADDAHRAERLIHEQFPGRALAGSDIRLTLALSDAARPAIRRLAVLTDEGEVAVETQTDGALRATRRGTLARRNVVIEGGAYWSLRRAGIDGETSRLAARLLPARAANGTLILVTGSRPDRFSAKDSKRLLYVEWMGGSERRRWVRSNDGEWHALEGGQGGGLARPVSGRLTSAFGMRRHPILGFARFHRGIDFAAGWGTPVRAAADGVVTDAGWRGGYGRQVRIAHPQSLVTSYAHLSAMTVAPGSRVRSGDLIGYIGASGLATGPHLHFEVLRGGRPVDPLSAAGAGIQAGRADLLALAERLRSAPAS